ncbi:MAG: S8 family serine peptidase, partial [Halieaceae bacterium]
MNKQSVNAALSALLLVFAAAGSAAAGPEDPNELKVMLQGGPANALAKLVHTAGGTVTHKLHIINAVGATITREQLDSVITSPLVQRHIDDLANTGSAPDEPEDSAEACTVAGALDLEMGPDGINWRLYKRGDVALTSTSLTMTWPTVLGELKGLSIAEEEIARPQLSANDAGSISLSFTADNAPKFTKHTALKASFSNTVPAVFWENVQQSDFNIALDFGKDCKTELIPGYSDNHNNSYYPTVVGADALHKHGITGSGITVAVLDSGLWDTPELVNDTAGKPRIVARYDAINDSENGGVFDESGHGTHMTSIVAHSGPVLVDNKPTG